MDGYNFLLVKCRLFLHSTSLMTLTWEILLKLWYAFYLGSNFCNIFFMLTFFFALSWEGPSCYICLQFLCIHSTAGMTLKLLVLKSIEGIFTHYLFVHFRKWVAGQDKESNTFSLWVPVSGYCLECLYFS